MFFLYNILTHITKYILKVIALFNPKIKLFVKGRKHVFKTLKNTISTSDKTIWIHTASLGEFEQGLPIIEKLKLQYPTYKIIVSFFSPSGYEVKKNNPIADCIVYLPLDTKKNVTQYLDLAQPDLAIFVKYEFWPNYLNELKQRNIPTLLVSGIFRKNQIFFKPFGKGMRKSLHAFSYFFVQNEHSKELLNSISFKNVAVAGDTRYDRVSEILERDNSLDFIADFKENKTVIVYGSSWEDDEAIYLDFLNNSTGIKHIIAPHDIKPRKIEKLKKGIQKSVVLYSEKEGKNLANYDVFIIDTIGLLTKIYSYADIGFVGGAFKTGLHNVLEPAVFGIPVIIGPEYNKFQEAVDLVNQKGVISINSKNEYETIIQKLITHTDYRKETGNINASFIKQQSGATNEIVSYISKTLK
ncbi:3-deoxy-D-manno-octulosonic acid transferase [Pseudofulvibacter geojedonensis]|uniref:3-deoxy-D-manno-octulosonic acid transferase n=1 Tax=Pseudofulvibacter geojedonensis TaxID=1123758 RepID=A0ABW3I604_9FLAO